MSGGLAEAGDGEVIEIVKFCGGFLDEVGEARLGGVGVEDAEGGEALEFVVEEAGQIAAGVAGVACRA